MRHRAVTKRSDWRADRYGAGRVEDDRPFDARCAETLEGEGVEGHQACTPEEALGRLAEVLPEVVFTDVRMPGMDGLSLLRVLRERVPEWTWW